MLVQVQFLGDFRIFQPLDGKTQHFLLPIRWVGIG